MSQADVFVRGLQAAINQNPALEKFWEGYSGDVTSFYDVLNKYAEYYNDLSSDQKSVASEIFWTQVKAIHTPIIEDTSQDQCRIYFLFRKDRIAESEEMPGTKKDLYLQGDEL